MFNKGHKIIDAEKLNNFLKEILPKDTLTKFERNFIAYKIAENEDQITKPLPLPTHVQEALNEGNGTYKP